ncbi:MAG: hypothetical protein ACI8P0_002108 [Planctomycetaceae bacterium]|jgi:hypothetical protein
MNYEIRELSIGGILDEAINLTKNHFGAFFAVVAVTLLPFSLIQSGINIAFMPQDVPLIQTPEESAAVRKALVENLPVLVGAVLLSLLVVPIANAALVRIVANTYLGESTSLGDAIGSAFGMIIPLYWTWLLLMIAVTGGMILCLIPGIIAAFWFSLATQVVVIEKINGFAALKRSRELMRGNVGTVFVLSLVLGMISVSAQGGAMMIPQAHAKAVITVVINCVTTVFTSAAMVVFYFSCRCGYEQFDLQRLAQNVGLADGDIPAGADVADEDNPFLGE